MASVSPQCDAGNLGARVTISAGSAGWENHEDWPGLQGCLDLMLLVVSWTSGS